MENKFSRYLLYAFGEVVLVVVGILIALQVNNHNEELKRQQESRAIIEELRMELTTVETELRKDVEKTTSFFDTTRHYIERCVTQQVSKLADSLKAKSVLILIDHTSAVVSAPTLNAVLSQGKASPINDKNLLRKLRLLNANYEQIVGRESILDIFFSNQLQTYIAKSKLMIPALANLGKDSSMDQILVRVYDDDEFENLIAVKFLLQLAWFSDQKKALVETEKLLSSLP